LEISMVGNKTCAIGVLALGNACFGGGIAPSVAGYVAKHFGIQYIMQLGMGALVLGLFVALALKETAPVRIARTAALARS